MKNFTILSVVLLISLCGCMERIGNIKPNTDDPKDPSKLSGELVWFKIEAAKNPSVGKDLDFRIYANKNVTTYASSDFALTSLKASFEVNNGTLSVDNVVQQSGVTTNDFSKTLTYTLTGNDGVKSIFTVRLAPYTGLPVVEITTNSEVEIGDRENWLPAKMSIDGMGKFDNMEDSLYVRGRGNGSWKYPKKPFNAKMYAKTQVLGMNKHKRWCFLANYRDRTLLRNDVTFRIGAEAAGLEWTPKGEFAEVIFNGKPQGNFYICEHIRVDSKRVNIDEMKAGDVEGEALTGGYLLELDRYYDEVNKFRSTINDWPVNLKDPDEDVCQEAQLTYIKEFFNESERLLSVGEFETVYDTYLDIKSFADFFLVQTLVGNTELSSIYSVYCYKKRNGKIFAGPLWDFDLSVLSTESEPTNANTIWYKYMLKDPIFKAALKSQFAALKSNLDGKIEPYIRARSQYIRSSVDENWKQWEIDIELMYNRLNGDETMQYDESIERMVRMYNARIAWLEGYVNGL